MLCLRNSVETLAAANAAAVAHLQQAPFILTFGAVRRLPILTRFQIAIALPFSRAGFYGRSGALWTSSR